MYVNLIAKPEYHSNLYSLNNSLHKDFYPFVSLKDNLNEYVIFSYYFVEKEVADKFLKLAAPYIFCGSIGSQKPSRISIDPHLEKPYLQDEHAILPANKGKDLPESITDFTL